ncbi:hypothetical protein SDRG_10832 [Saprolegnia diclina VS20]|uniref:Uncharacterized protein n=1 Tax=Saprolegnia diclina (strain VS20) TaxID=1156394 RepID=T0RNP3_SAPDV|nr:hypothetical protein SDRG_10832 [Saprolegnia diclina VS20]EQC31667.1 hypothetical protein SDRG_10832 [Saprolegnia diclina VS20]|eukprot:XP_008615066.1 hypothetical protein SDRG_10832 [Saprolegnia diclina VS20]
MDAIHQILVWLVRTHQVIITFRFVTHVFLRPLFWIAVRLAPPLARYAIYSFNEFVRRETNKLARKFTTQAIAEFGFVATIAAIASVYIITRYISPETRMLSPDPRHKCWNKFLEAVLYEPTEKPRRRQNQRCSSNASM